MEIFRVGASIAEQQSRNQKTPYIIERIPQPSREDFGTWEDFDYPTAVHE